jgi:hypothetical protein
MMMLLNCGLYDRPLHWLVLMEVMWLHLMLYYWLLELHCLLLHDWHHFFRWPQILLPLSGPSNQANEEGIRITLIVPWVAVGANVGTRSHLVATSCWALGLVADVSHVQAVGVTVEYIFVTLHVVDESSMA